MPDPTFTEISGDIPINSIYIWINPIMSHEGSIGTTEMATSLNVDFNGAIICLYFCVYLTGYLLQFLTVIFLGIRTYVLTRLRNIFISSDTANPDKGNILIK